MQGAHWYNVMFCIEENVTVFNEGLPFLDVLSTECLVLCPMKKTGSSGGVRTRGS